MAKKRIYALAKELGVESKELLARLEKMGISGKSASSTLEEAEVARVQREFLAQEPHEVVEKRIKSTVIRRRNIRLPEEQPAPLPAGEPEQAPPREKAKEVPHPAVEAGRAEIAPKKPAAAAAPAPAAPSSAAAKEGAAPREAALPKKEEHKKPVAPAVAPEVKAVPERAAAEKKPAPAPPAAPAAGAKVAGARVERPAKKEEAKAPAPPVQPAPAATEEEKKEREKREEEKLRKKGKAPVEILMDERLRAPKKALIKKITDRKVRRDEIEAEDRPVKWRAEKKPTVVRMQKPLITVPKAIKRRIKVGEAITVGELAKRMGVKAGEVINKLIKLGLMVTINQSIDFDTATLIASEFDYQVERAAIEYGETPEREEKASENLLPRAPVVTIMGHVDHGKTSLLDAIRQTNVISGEAGGITQAIGAYHVNIKGRDIVFLDTPGHEAFTAMRARGAQVTDIVVLVVAADDGIMDQTIEAINHSRVANVPIIVAINKIDKPGADPGKIKQALTEYNLLSEEWGGETIVCEVSAKKKQGIEELLEMILLQADMMELRADPDRPARGIIIESKLDRGRGPVATVLIQEGTLHEGDAFVSKTEFGRVRALISDQGNRIEKAGPSMPVEVIGFSRVPQVGAEFVGMDDERKARSIAEYWIRKERERELSVSSKITLEQLYQKIKEGVKEFNVILKADVRGSIEALTDALNKLSTQDIKLKIIHSSTGSITETDVMLASASDAVIIGFNVRPDARVVEIAEAEGVDIKLYDIIYNVIADIKAAMEGLLEPIYREVVQGRAEVRQLFKIPKVGTVAGSHVTDGKITRTSNLKLVRDGVVVYDGKVLSLKRFKDDVKEVAAGLECGIGIEGFNDIRVGDVIEAYIKEKVERKL